MTSKMKTRTGYTLIEILLATALSLLLLGTVVRIFMMMTDSFSTSRTLLEMTGRVRNAQLRLTQDLQNITVKMAPPRPVEAEDGYFIYEECNSSMAASSTVFKDLVDPNMTNDEGSITNNVDDIMAFTVCDMEHPFRFTDNGKVCETPYAEIAWFVYKNNLYRMVIPIISSSAESNLVSDGTKCANSLKYDKQPGSYLTTAMGTSGSLDFYRISRLGLLSNPEHRAFTMQSDIKASGSSQNDNFSTLSSSSFKTNCQNLLYSRISNATKEAINDALLVLPNVILFNVEVWDPLAKKYIDIGTSSNYYKCNPCYSGKTVHLTKRYDTWSTDLSSGGDAITKLVTGNYGTVDPAGIRASRTFPPPYTSTLPGIRVTVRTFERSTGQIREFTVTQDFITK